LNYSYPVNLNRLVLTNDGGNLVVARSAAYPQRIILTKTDSVATLPACSVMAQSATFQYQVPSYIADTIPAVAYSFQFTSPVIGVIDVPVNVTEDCKALYCPSPPQPDSCLRTFFKEYRNYTNSIVSYDITDMGGGKFLLLSGARPTPYVAVNQAQLTVIDTVGHLLDSRTLIAPEEITFYTLTRLRDGNFLGTGVLKKNSIDPWEIFLMKFDGQFSVIWQKKLVTTAPPYFNSIDAVLESTEGDIYCYLHDRVTTPKETRTLLKLDASGNPLWMQQYSIGPTVFAQSNEFYPALVEMEDAVVLKYNDEDSDFSPYLMRVRKTDGSLVWVRKYPMPGPYSGSNVFTLNSLVSDGKNIFMSGRSQGNNIFLKVRPDGSVAIARRSPPTSVNLWWMGLKPGGRLLASALMSTFQGSVNGVVELDTSFRLLRTQYMQVPRWGRVGTLVPYSDSVTYSAGSLWYDNDYWASIYFQKYNFNSSFASCAVSDQLLILDSFQQTSITKQISQVALTPPQFADYTASFSVAHLAYSRYYCGNNSACSSLDLQGPTLICDTTNTYSFPVVRNPGCNGIVVWKMDTLASQVKIISISDTLLKLKVRVSGQFKLSAKVFANCGWLEDSMTVQATAAVGKLDLGKDTALCPGNTYALHAGTGFSSYLWQDGTTDSVFTATKPGLYYVEVTSCGNTMKDSVTITAAPPIPFTVGPDRSKCNADTLHLSAPSGFINYTWINNYNISSTTTQSVVVNPLVDTAYYITAEKTPGCFAYDTVRVTVNHSPQIDLGADKSFCSGDSAVFNAGSGFSIYQWNNGGTSPQITVRSAGSYSVTGTTAQGCKSYDTIRILNVYSNPIVLLDHTPSLCIGAIRVLDAGNFSTYLWNNGSSSRTFTINDIGVYAVEVSDKNGCKGSDSTTITTLLPLPNDFLPADTAICSYGSLELKPLRTYSSSLWSNGASAPSITITQPGLYWLQVKDANNCTGKDTILVGPKDCMKGFYIPTAFTPNGDGKNDVFRPMLFGNVKKYQFTIYNRWGQAVFQTSDLSKSWDGTFGGETQDSNVFIWSCTYQFEGEEIKQEKGTVVVIR
jgi:gliding motility-associated-like protein